MAGFVFDHLNIRSTDIERARDFCRGRVGLADADVVIVRVPAGELTQKGKKFSASQPTTNQKSKNGMVPFAPETVALGLQQQRTALLSSKPIT